MNDRTAPATVDTIDTITTDVASRPLATVMSRRNVLRALGVVSIGSIAGGAALSSAGAATKTTKKKSTKTTVKSTTKTTAKTSLTTTTTKAVTSAANTETIPQETGGPYPGDGSNGPNVLTQSGVVRSDIRSSFGNSTTVAKGVPLTINVIVNKSGTPLSGYAVYLWHCNIDGKYSMYSAGVTNENYLRGVQPTDATGLASFKSIFPAAYDGRWPHIHFEVYPSVAKATTVQNAVLTSQIALPEDACRLVYATSGYSSSLSNLSRTSLSTDNVFSDGWDEELATVTGNATDGFVATLSMNI